MRLLPSSERRCIVFLFFLLSPFCYLSAQVIVSGMVTDSTGDPLRGVSVMVKGSSVGTSTHAAGKYSITAPSGESTLVFSNLGFLDKEEPVNNRTVINVTLSSSRQNLEEVIVTGYTRQSKRDITGAVSTISADVVAKTPVTDVGSVLQGRVAGVSVDAQGGPGSTAVVRIRGFGTNGNNDPLYVVDGVQMRGGNNLLNPNDIESINILKDPSLTSLYGAQGGNGVIVITTKTGKLGAPKLDYTTYASWSSPIKYPESLTPQEFGNAYWGYLKNSGLPQTDIFYGSGSTPVLPAYIIERQSGGPLYVGEGDPAADPSLYNLNSYRILKTNTQGTDWFRAVLKQSFSQNHQLTVSGATDKSNYALSFNYLEDKGLFLATYFKRYSIRVNTEFRPTSWLKIGENMQLSFSQGGSINNHHPQNIIADLYSHSPLIPMFDIAGNYSGPKGIPGTIAFSPGGNNPVYGQLQGRANSNGYNAGMISSAYVDIQPYKGVTFESKIGLQFSPYSYRYFMDTVPQNIFSSPYNSFSEGGGWSSDWRWTNKISYELNINQVHKITAFVAYETRRFTSRDASGSTPNLPYTTPGYLNLSNGAPNLTGGPYNTVSGSLDGATSVSQFGNVTYSLLDKYLFSYVIRRDGSSKFGPLSKYGTFPSYSAGWRVSEEKFMNNINWLNDFKIRAAVGSNGNDAIPSGLYENQYNTNTYVSSYDIGGLNGSAATGVGLYQIGNPRIHWETNKTTNIGFDLALFKNRFTASFSWFNRQTKDLLAVPPISGLQGDALAPFQNVMKFSNKGIELEMAYAEKIGKLRYEIGFNIATYKNNVDYINGDSTDRLDGDSYAPTHFALTRSVMGRPVSSFFGYKQIGIFQSAKDYQDNNVIHQGIADSTAAGHFKFEDINKDGKIDDDDRTFIGSPHPKFTYGLNLNLYYGNFDLNIFFQGVYGNDIFNYWRAYSVWPGALGKGSLDTWSTDNTDAKLPIWNNNGSDDRKPSSFFVENGSYLRLKSLLIGYTLPKVKAFKSLRIYVQAYNLVTITDYSGIDPEVSTGSATNAGVDFGGNYPLSRKFLVGLNFDL